jgi:hypothetical protein
VTRPRPTAWCQPFGLALLRGPWALGTVLLCLLASAANLAHLVAVRHTTCAAHAEVIHGPSFELPAKPATAPEVAPEAEPSHSEDHCRAFSFRKRELGLEPPQVAPSPPPTPRAPKGRAPIIETACPADGLLLVAPKTSPPA